MTTVQKITQGVWNPLVQAVLAVGTMGTVLFLFATGETVPGELLVFAGTIVGTYFPKTTGG